MDKPGSLRHAAVIEYLQAPVSWFYSELGFDKRVADEIPDTEYMSALSGGGLQKVAISKFANEQGSIIEIISIPMERPAVPLPWNHVAVTVRDCAATVDSLVAGGGTLIGGPVRSTSGPYVVAYVRDPSGNLVEVVQRQSGFEG